MGFDVGEIIIYGSNGVCKIEDIREESFFKEAPKKYYFLKPLFVKSTSVIYVPFDNPAQTDKIKPIMTSEEADKFIEELPVKGMEWIDDRNRRKEKFMEILSSGTRTEIAGIIHLISEHRKLLASEGKKLNAQDERALAESLNRINNELAVVKGMDPSEVEKHLISRVGT